MLRLSAIRRYAPWRSSVRGSPSGHAIVQSSPLEPLCSPSGPASASETLGRRPFVSFHSVSYFRLFPVLGRQIDDGVLCSRQFSTINERDDMALEEEVERKVGWLLKAIFVVTAFGVASQFFPYMGDNLLQQSISLLHVKDPLFKRMGASRLRRFAIDDERRMKVVEMGGAQDLLTMLEGAKDDKTRKEALKALLALSHSDAVAEVLQQAGAAALVASAPDSSDFTEISNYKSSLLTRFRQFEHNPSPSEFQLT